MKDDEVILKLNPNNPLGRHTGESRYPAMKNMPRSGQNQAVVPLAWGFFNHLDTGFRRYDAIFSNELSGLKVKYRRVYPCTHKILLT